MIAAQASVDPIRLTHHGSLAPYNHNPEAASTMPMTAAETPKTGKGRLCERKYSEDNTSPSSSNPSPKSNLRARASERDASSSFWSASRLISAASLEYRS